VICELEEFEPHFFITVDRINNSDTLEIQVEVKEAANCVPELQRERIRTRISFP
jgi:phenylacetate-CoA ligase